MSLQIKKSSKAIGKFFQKMPHGTMSSDTKSQALKDITEYVHENGDFGNRNYIHIERFLLGRPNEELFLNINT